MFDDKTALIQQITAENVNLTKEIEDKVTEAVELSRKIQTIQWNIKKSDFVGYCEDMEHDQQRSVMNQLTEKISKDEERRTSLDKGLDAIRVVLDELRSEKERNSAELRWLQEIDSKNGAKLYELSRTVQILENRNAAVKIKLKKQRQDFEEQIKKLSAQLINLPSV